MTLITRSGYCAAAIPGSNATAVHNAAISERIQIVYTLLARIPGREDMRITNVGRVFAASALLAFAGTAFAGTYVYVSNADDGDIGTYTLQSDGTLQPGARVKAASLVMPMAVSPDKRVLYAAVRSRPFAVLGYSIDAKTGELKQFATAALAESYPYISVDRSGRVLLGASYGGHQVGVNTIGKDGKVSDPVQVIPTGRNAHSIITDRTNQYVFVPHLGTDQIFQFKLD